MKPLSSTSNFNIYFKRIAAFLLALAFVYGVATVTAHGLDLNFDINNGTQKITASQLSDFYNLPVNSLDVIILGSSHAMCTFDPARFESDLNLSAFNLGTALQQPDTAYHLLKEVLKTQTPKYLIYDVYFKTMQNEYSNEQVATVLKEMPLSTNSLSLFWSSFNVDGKVDYYNNWINPFGKIQNVMENPARRTGDAPAAYVGRGFYCTNGVVAKNLLEESAHPFDKEYPGFSSRQVKYLKKLIALAQENNIQVILTSTPLPPTIFSRITYYDRILSDTNEIAELFNVPFYDFASSAKQFLWDTDFSDQGHLNRSGSAKFMTRFLFKTKDILPPQK